MRSEPLKEENDGSAFIHFFVAYECMSTHLYPSFIFPLDVMFLIPNEYFFPEPFVASPSTATNSMQPEILWTRLIGS